ncbi:hypothetical protein ACFLZ1_00195 [Patescibacteria group bacterium]
MFIYSTAFKISYITFIIPTLLVVISATLSAKEMGGTLGRGLKKIAVGSIIHTILIMTYLLLERGNRGLLGETAVRIFFIFCGISGAVFLTIGYMQIYKIAKKLKLFSV